VTSENRSLLTSLEEDDLPIVKPKVEEPFLINLTPATPVDIPLLLSDSAEFAKYGGLKVIICKGDITEEYTDAIVNGVMQNFDLSVGMYCIVQVYCLKSLVRLVNQESI